MTGEAGQNVQRATEKTGLRPGKRDKEEKKRKWFAGCTVNKVLCDKWMAQPVSSRDITYWSN